MPTRKPAPGKPRAGLKAASLASNIVTPKAISTNGKVYGTSALNGRRHRRTNAELEEIDDAGQRVRHGFHGCDVRRHRLELGRAAATRKSPAWYTNSTR